MWYGRWHLKVANSHFFNLSHHDRKGSWNLKTGLKTQFSFSFCLLLHQGKSDSKTLDLSLSNANGHITLNTPVLVRSLKLSNVESSQYLDGWPPGNTGCCWLLFFVLFYSFLSTLLIHFRPPSPVSSPKTSKTFSLLNKRGRWKPILLPNSDFWGESLMESRVHFSHFVTLGTGTQTQTAGSLWIWERPSLLGNPVVRGWGIKDPEKG